MASLPPIDHLEDFRRSFTEGAPPLPDMTQRLLLDTLDVGNKQAFDFLAFSRPSQAEFEAWIVETAGVPDADLVSRYNARVAEGEMSETAKAHLQAIDAMPDALDPDEIAHWESEGYVVVSDAVDVDLCTALAEALWTHIGASADDQQSWYHERTDGIMVPLYQHAAQVQARRSPRIHKAFAQLWGTADLWVTIDQMGFNPPEHGEHIFRGSPVHWDVSLVQPIPFGTQAVLYLTDTAEDQGAFRCVPGFHHRIDNWLDGLGDQTPREVNLENEARCVAGKAGDLVIWRQDLPHGASPNRSDCPRLVQYLNYYSPELEVAQTWI